MRSPTSTGPFCATLRMKPVHLQSRNFSCAVVENIYSPEKCFYEPLGWHFLCVAHSVVKKTKIKSTVLSTAYWKKYRVQHCLQCDQVWCNAALSQSLLPEQRQGTSGMRAASWQVSLKGSWRVSRRSIFFLSSGLWALTEEGWVHWKAKIHVQRAKQKVWGWTGKCWKSAELHKLKCNPQPC